MFTLFKSVINRLLLSLFFVLFLGLPIQTFSQVNDIKDEILVYFLPDSLEMPNEITELTDLTKLKIKSKNLEKLFKKIKLKSIKKAFSEFNINDTLKILADGKKIKMPNMTRIFKLKLKNKDDLQEVIQLLSKEKGVLFAEKQSNMQLHTDDADYTKQWHLNNTGQLGGTIDSDIDAPEAWAIFNGSSNIKLAIMDTGIETNHDDLTGKSSGDLPENYPFDGYAHGTHVAGIAGAIHGNIGKVKGVDANVQILSRKVFSGYQYNPTTGMDEPKWAGDDIAYNKIVDAVNNGANVFNNSYGDSEASITLRAAFAYAYKSNSVAVVSMGNNNGNQIQYPAGFGQGIIAVGATDNKDVIASYSNTGNHIDISSPGSLIYSTWRGNDYDYLSGTSMAAPVVSGIASLLKGYNPNLYNDDIEHIIQLSADDKGDLGWDQYYGYGRVNAKTALDLLRYPYSFNQLSASGGTDYFKGPAISFFTFGASGLADGAYIAYRHEVRKTVYFSSLTNPNVWGRGVATIGWSAENANFGMGYCNVVPGTVTSNSAILYTYVYEVYSTGGQWLGWYPTTPSGVQFAYTTLGTPASLSISIFGDNYITSGQNGTWTANADGGYTPYTYDWYYRYPGALPKNSSIKKPPAGYWNLLGIHTYQMSRTDNQDFELKCVVKDNLNNTATSNIIYVYVTGGLPGIASQVTENELIQNHPNPFNPSTEIKYSLKSDNFVTIKVYDVLGRVVATLVNENKPAGFYTINFDASKLSSGVYFYTIKTDEFFDRKKMILLR